jgi:ATP-dependent DNA helicase PIF1
MLVVLLVNLDIERGLVNGSQGVVLGFKPIDPAQLPEQVGEHAGRKKAQIKIFVDRAKVKQWPLVRFHNGVTRLIKAHCAISELGESSPYSLMSRTQVPLLAAWAMTIHKSQGMTLSRVDVNISKVFEKGQAYVALSRATSLQGLNVQALGNCNQGGNEQVMEFLQEKFGKDVIEGMVSGSTDLADLDKN